MTTAVNHDASPPPREVTSIDPATLEELGRAPVFTEAGVRAAVAKARAAQPAWGALTYKQRGRVILRARDLLIKRQDRLCALIARETGKPELEALTSEVFPAANLMDYFARGTQKMLQPEEFSLSIFRNKKSRIQYYPYGVMGVISPWNYPLSIPMGHVVMALMAGNAVVLKPSERTSLTALELDRLFQEAGLAEGLLCVVTGDAETGMALAGAGIDKIFFTGSVAAGKKINTIAAARMMPAVLEMGGKDAMIVCADAPLDRTVNGALWGAFNNCGQACASVERVYVARPIADAFLHEVVSRTRDLRVGPSGQGEFEIGPLNNAKQLETVMAHVEDAVARGAKVLTGGRRIVALPGYFYEPTVLVNVNHTMRIMREETFGPVLPVMVVENEEEAIQAANDSSYGLLASVWTKNTTQGKRIASRLEAGTVLINDAVYTHGAPETPWFGIKESGTGITHSHHGLREFVRMKHLNWDRLPLKSNLWWFPYSGKKHRRFKRLAGLLHKAGLKRWL